MEAPAQGAGFGQVGVLLRGEPQFLREWSEGWQLNRLAFAAR